MRGILFQIPGESCDERRLRSYKPPGRPGWLGEILGGVRLGRLQSLGLAMRRGLVRMYGKVRMVTLVGEEG